MTLYAPRLPFPLHPLIGEAKRRTRQRRLLVLSLLLLVAGIGIAMTLALRSPSGPNASGTVAGERAHSDARLAHVVVRVGKTERQWRAWIREQTPPSSPPPDIRIDARAIRREVLAAVAISGATLVRLRVWGTYAFPPVELVVATKTPASFLEHHLNQVLNGIGGKSAYRFFEVVNAHGSKILVYAHANSDTAFVKPRLQGCVFPHSAASKYPACPVE